MGNSSNFTGAAAA